ncbi:MAG: DUF1822 family protein [Spirulina sp. SIO3F2]|nr:DUF1822 family protein [Spirulina sp. SIO3F2]
MPMQPDLMLTMPVTLSAHKRAQTRHRQQTRPHKARQVYLNTLAIAVVSDYLNALGITADPSHSDNLVLQTLSDSAALFIPGWGELECRPVEPGKTTCYVPPEVWAECQGYVAVQFDSELTQATLLGYLPVVAEEQVPLHRFEGIETLLKALSNQPLSQWFNGVVARGWETVETLFNSYSQPAFAFRSVRSASTSEKTIQRGKWIHLERDHNQIALLVELAKTPEPDLDISVQVFPERDRILPNDLKLFILDDQGESVMQASARESDSLTCEFSGQPGEQFGVKLKMGQFCLIEEFLI